ncbi:hypothetical protein F7R14_13960 [Pseudomonas lini]|uniref:Uncharacterized protein n=1 Tax=Pseudomonas lini TaxID=163011 RepID=A0A7V7P3X3_9PSED|nr:hypothetical protein F7R14_13960 [Pseudomonas lini]MDT9676323.1 hypothetical protein [Pseudomonas sp. JV414]
MTYACAPLMCVFRYGGCTRETFGSAGFSPPRVPTCVQLPPLRLEPMEQLKLITGDTQCSKLLPTRQNPGPIPKHPSMQRK